MDEAEARIICKAENATHEQAVAADKWIKNYALEQLQVKLRRSTNNATVRAYVKLMVRHTFGTAETVRFLWEMGCYPEWLRDC